MALRDRDKAVVQAQDAIRQASESKRIATLARGEAEKSAQEASNAHEQAFMVKRQCFSKSRQQKPRCEAQEIDSSSALAIRLHTGITHHLTFHALPANDSA